MKQKNSKDSKPKTPQQIESDKIRSIIQAHANDIEPMLAKFSNWQQAEKSIDKLLSSTQPDKPVRQTECPRCYGRGYVGKNQHGEYLPCKCLHSLFYSWWKSYVIAPGNDDLRSIYPDLVAKIYEEVRAYQEARLKEAEALPVAEEPAEQPVKPKRGRKPKEKIICDSCIQNQDKEYPCGLIKKYADRKENIKNCVAYSKIEIPKK